MKILAYTFNRTLFFKLIVIEFSVTGLIIITSLEVFYFVALIRN